MNEYLQILTISLPLTWLGGVVSQKDCIFKKIAIEIIKITAIKKGKPTLRPFQPFRS